MRIGGELLAETDFHSWNADYIWLDPGRNSTPIGEVIPTTTPAIYFTHTDRQKTVQKLTNASQTVVWSALYNPFGDTHCVTIGSGGPTIQSLRLPGQQYDAETGYNHNGFRDYAGAFTRYIQYDPIGLGGGINPYQYALGNPWRYVDPWGLAAVCGAGAITNALPGPLSNVTVGGSDVGLGAIEDLVAGILGLASDASPLASLLLSGDTPDNSNAYMKPPSDAYDVDGAKAPGKPTEADGFSDPSGGDEWVKNPNGSGNGWLDEHGNVWVPTGKGGAPGTGTSGPAHGGPHWDVQIPGRKGYNVYPGGRVR